jgi:molecular chaperone GrpE
MWGKAKKMSDPVKDNQQAQGQSAQEQPTPEQELELDLKKLQEERDGLFERLARVTADFKNAQRRLEDDKKQAIEYANSNLITALLPVIDNFERALSVDQSKTDVGAILKGMQLIHDQWIMVLKAQHVEQIAPKVGDKFDPSLHQAIMQQPSEHFKDAKEPVVTMLLQKGYAMRGRVLRPAQVAVNAIGG